MLVNVAGKQTYAYTANRPVDTALPCIVFLHGAANDHSVWSLQSRYFAHHGWNALALDLPGHGRSEGEPLNRVEALADWLVAFLDASDIPQCCIAGHSMGSLAGLETAARYPSRVSALALIGTAVPMPVSDVLLRSSADNDHVAYEMINAFAHSPRAQLGGNRVPGAWMLGANMRLMERSAPGLLHADFTACNAYARGMEAASDVKCPVLLVLGQRDQMTPPRGAKQVAGNFSDARTVVLEGSGHSLMSEQPDAVLDALIGFLSSAQPTPA